MKNVERKSKSKAKTKINLKPKRKILSRENLLLPHAVAGYGFIRLAADDEISIAVIQAVSWAAHYPVELIQLNYVLKEAPLSLDTNGLRALADKLNKSIMLPEARINISDFDSGKLKVGDLITIVKKRIKQ